MKPFTFILALLLSGLLHGQNKLALIVAVGQYAPGSNIPPIASVSDVKYIRAALNKNGFIDKNIQVLVNAKATKAGILKQLTELAVKARKKDIVVLHFACHGQQIRDQRTVEMGKDEEDGYDEALLPYDAKARYHPIKYRGENHLRDDDLFPRLMAIRKAIGPEGSMLVLLDACHSGTGTRSESFAVTRGDPVPFPDPENPLDSIINLSGAEQKQGFFESIADSVSNMVVISGSAPHQENKQVVVNYEELGSLSYAFYKAMSDMPPGNTYGFLFEKIKATIQAYIPDQMPMIEGVKEQKIFSGEYMANEERTYIRVGLKNIPAPKDSVFTFDRGLMENMVAGTHCKIYKAGSNEVFAHAIIRKVETFRSIGVADRLLSRDSLYEFKQEEENYGNLTAGVKLKFEEAAVRSSKTEAQVRKLLQPYKFIALTDNADFQLAVQKESGLSKAILTDRNNTQLWSGDITKDDSLSVSDKKEVITNIKKAMRVKYLRTMPDGGDLFPFITAEIIPAVPYDTAKGIVLAAGDSFYLRIYNNTDKKLFYSVLDIYPDNKVEVLYPYKGKTPGDYIINAHSPVLRKLTVSKNTPLGREFFKIIVSKEEMDLRSVFEQNIQRDEMYSFQTVLDDLFNERDVSRATRADIANVKVEEIGIVSVHFTVKAK